MFFSQKFSCPALQGYEMDQCALPVERTAFNCIIPFSTKKPTMTEDTPEMFQSATCSELLLGKKKQKQADLCNYAWMCIRSGSLQRGSHHHHVPLIGLYSLRRSWSLSSLVVIERGAWQCLWGSTHHVSPSLNTGAGGMCCNYRRT